MYRAWALVVVWSCDMCSVCMGLGNISGVMCRGCVLCVLMLMVDYDLYYW